MPDKIGTKKTDNNQQGVVLIITLMILSLIMVSALSLSQIIFNEIKMSINTGNSIIAYYSAEAGIEKALYSIKYSRQQSDFENIFLALPDEGEVNIEDTDQKYEVTQATVDSTGYTAYDISTSSPAYVDIVDPSGKIDNLPWGESYTTNYLYDITWKIKDCFPYHASDKLEVSYTSFDDSNFVVDTEKKVVMCNCEYDSLDECQLLPYTILNNQFYRFMLRPLDSTAESLEFNLYLLSSLTDPVGILSQAAVSVDGNYHNSTYTISASLPSLVPTSYSFNYVIFSEEPIIKDL